MKIINLHPKLLKSVYRSTIKQEEVSDDLRGDVREMKLLQPGIANICQGVTHNELNGFRDLIFM